MSSAASYPWLVADIGGTNARFGLVRDGTGAVSDVRKLKAADHASLQAAALAYLEGLGTRVHRGALALASAVHADPVKLTNSDWIVSRAEIAEALRIERVLLLNDFEALALSLPRLRVGADVQLFGAAAQPDSALPMAVVGPGTGLGVAGCVPNGRGWTALATEGGHATMAAADAFEDALIALVRREHAHVSAERLLSGSGLPTLHRAVCALRGAALETLAPQEITSRAIGGDAIASTTLDTFCAMLGTFAGNVALTLGARGGVYVGGGIAQQLGNRFMASRFRERFEAKGRFRTYVSGIATGLIIAPDPALAGAAIALMQSTT